MGNGFEENTPATTVNASKKSRVFNKETTVSLAVMVMLLGGAFQSGIMYNRLINVEDDHSEIKQVIVKQQAIMEEVVSISASNQLRINYLERHFIGPRGIKE